MDNPHTQQLNRSSKICILLSHMALCTTSAYSTLLLLVPILAIALFPITSKFEQGNKPYTIISTIFTLLFIGYTPFYTLEKGLVSGVVLLIIFIQLFSLLHKKDVQNYMHIVMMSTFIYTATLVMYPSPFIGVILIAFIYYLVKTLITLERWKLAKECTSLTKKSKPKQSPKQINSFALSAYIFALTLALFVFLPRVEAGIMGGTHDIGQQKEERLENETSFNVVRRMTGSSTTILKAKFTGKDVAVDKEDLYWRTIALDKYSPEGWSKEGLKTEGWSREELRTPLERHRKDITSGFILQQHFRRANRKDLERSTLFDENIFAYEVVFANGVNSPLPLLNTVTYIAPLKPQGSVHLEWLPGRDFGVEVQSRFQERYLVYAQMLNPTPGELRATSNNYLDIMLQEDFRLLTEHDLQPRTINLVNRITAGQRSSYDKIEAINRYMKSNQFIYNDSIPELDKEHPLDNFIHDVRIGHCELFAGAMTLMVRSLGIPARTVSGYRGATYSQTDATYTVNSGMAHLWLEVYFPEYGWVTFDPTPTIGEYEPSSMEKFESKVSAARTYVNNLWFRYIIAYKPQFKLSGLEGSSVVLFGDWASSIISSGKQGTLKAVDYAKISIVFIAPTILIVLLYHGVRLLINLRQKAHLQRLSVEQQQARELYLKLIAKLKKLGITIDNLTADEVMNQLRIHNAFPIDELDTIAQFLVRYHEIRFGQQVLHKNELNQYSSMIKQLNQQPAT